MRSSACLVLWLCAVVTCICNTTPAEAASSHKTAISHHRPRSTLLALVRAATALHHHKPPPLDHRYLDTLPEETLAAYPALYRRHHAATHDNSGVPAQQTSYHSYSLHRDDQEEQDEEAAQQEQQDRLDEEVAAVEAAAADIAEPGLLEDRRVLWSKRGGGSGRGSVSSSSSEIGSVSSNSEGGGSGGGARLPGEEVANSVQQVEASLATNFLRHARSGGRPYDVPQIECPPADDQMERFPCPSPDRMGRYRCIDDHVLCDGFIDCPQGEDEDRQQCMFYKTTKAHLDVLADAIIRWARGGK